VEIVGGKVWHIYRPDSSRPSDVLDWRKKADRRAANGYVVTPNVEGHPVDRVCPYCKVQVVVAKKPEKGDLYG
jgi:hypothetical protein